MMLCSWFHGSSCVSTTNSIWWIWSIICLYLYFLFLWLMNTTYPLAMLIVHKLYLFLLHLEVICFLLQLIIMFLILLILTNLHITLTNLLKNLRCYLQLICNVSWIRRHWLWLNLDLWFLRRLQFWFCNACIWNLLTIIRGLTLLINETTWPTNFLDNGWSALSCHHKSWLNFFLTSQRVNHWYLSLIYGTETVSTTCRPLLIVLLNELPILILIVIIITIWKRFA